MRKGLVEWFMVKYLAIFWNYLKEAVFKEGCCCLEKIENFWGQGRNPGIEFQGIDIELSEDRVIDALNISCPEFLSKLKINIC